MFVRALPAFLLASVLFIAACESTGVDLNSLSGEAQAAMDILPSDAVLVGMLDVHDLANDKNFPWISSLDAINELEGEARSHVSDFLSSTGFNPDEDLTSIFVALGPSNDDAVVVASASYDMDRIVAFLDSNARDAVKYTYRDYVVYEMDAGDGTGAVGLLGGSTIIAGPSSAAVQHAFDRAIDRTPGVSSNAPVMNLVRKVAGSPAWLVAADIASFPVESENDIATMLAAIGSVAVGMEPGVNDATITTYLTPSADLATSDLADLTKGIVAVLKVEAKNDPETFAILDKITIKEVSSDVRVRVVVTNDLLAQHMH